MKEGLSYAEELSGGMDFEDGGFAAEALLEYPTESVAASTSKTIFNTPSVKHTDPGSSGRTSCSCFTPSKMQSESDSETAVELQDTDPALLDRFYVVQGKKLLELFNLSRCGCRNDGESGVVRLTQHSSGAIPLIEYVTKGPNAQIRKWEGRDNLETDEEEKLYAGTILANSAASEKDHLVSIFETVGRDVKREETHGLI
ncbi:unnamed protein product [Cylicostephanus goldi]|uniref:Uncharacterized protein n=1 Tax=Cylicostephanus goldi TaxID=71465 RepID=A0A3P6S3C8_CYLGO|nr:unnamed protein product [Cylicostephanus goldi]